MTQCGAPRADAGRHPTGLRAAGREAWATHMDGRSLRSAAAPPGARGRRRGRASVRPGHVGGPAAGPWARAGAGRRPRRQSATLRPGAFRRRGKAVPFLLAALLDTPAAAAAPARPRVRARTRPGSQSALEAASGAAAGWGSLSSRAKVVGWELLALMQGMLGP